MNINNLAHKFQTHINGTTTLSLCCYYSCLTMGLPNCEYGDKYPEMRLIKLYKKGYYFTNNNCELIMSLIIRGRSKSYVMKCYTSNNYRKVIKLLFNDFTPSQSQVTKLIDCYKSVPEIDERCFFPFDYLTNKGYKFTMKQIENLTNINYKPKLLNKKQNFTINELSNILSKTVSDFKYVNYAIKQAQNIEDNTILIELLVENNDFHRLCKCERSLYNTVIDPDYIECTKDCKSLIKWQNLINLMINKGCKVSKKAIQSFLAKDSKVILNIMSQLLKLSDTSPIIDKTLYDSINKKNIMFKLYIADKYNLISVDTLVDMYYYYTGIGLTFNNDIIKRYCTKYFKTDDNLTVYISNSLLSHTRSEDDPIDYNELMCTKIGDNIEIDPIDTEIIPYDVSKQLYDIGDTIEHDDFVCGVYHMLDIIKYHNIQPDIKLMAHAINNKDLVSYNEFKTTYKIEPDINCLYMGFKQNLIPIIKDILCYKIMPDYKCYKYTIKYYEYGIENDNIDEIFTLLISNGLNVDYRLMKNIIKHDYCISEPNRFPNLFDTRLYFWVYYGTTYRLPITQHYYSHFFDQTIMDKHKIRMGFINNNRVAVKKMIKDNIPIDRYCLINAGKNKDPSVYNYLIKLGCEPVIDCLYYNKNDLGDKKVHKVYKALVNKFYGGFDKYIELLEKPYVFA